jgi:hypothetical protein
MKILPVSPFEYNIGIDYLNEEPMGYMFENGTKYKNIY